MYCVGRAYSNNSQMNILGKREYKLLCLVRCNQTESVIRPGNIEAALIPSENKYCSNKRNTYRRGKHVYVSNEKKSSLN